MEIKLHYSGLDYFYQCNDLSETLNHIFNKLRNNVNVNAIIFFYSGNQIDGNISISKFASKANLKKNKMSIVVLDKDKEAEPVYIQSKDIICPKCGDVAKLDILEYKLFLQCRNKHNLGNILLNEYEKTQRIDITKIICDECKNNNKAKSYKNIFYRCNECKKNICISCRDKHKKQNEEHNIINYDEKNYICNIHNLAYTSYCKNCNKNICLYCKNDHIEKKHEIINYEIILPRLDDVKRDIDKLRNNINLLNNLIDELLKLQNIKDFIEYYYNINNDIYNSLKNKQINYELLYSYNKINKSDIINDINNIINNENNRYKILTKISNNIKTKFNEEITIQYLIEDNDDNIRLFGKFFVDNNKENCKIILDGKEIGLKDTIELNNIHINNNQLEIKLKGIQNVNDMSGLFSNCSYLKSLPDISKWNTSNINSMSCIFSECSSLISLPDISNWNTINVNNMSFMFYECSSIKSLPDLSKWNTSNVNYFDSMFSGCSSINSLPNMSEWNTSNVKSMAYMFNNCSSIKSLPDLSKWITSNVNNMNYMFYNCSSLESLPDISRWETRNVKKMMGMFERCSSLNSLPNISNWNIPHVNYMSYMFDGCPRLSNYS